MNFEEFLKKKKFIPESERYNAEGLYSSGRSISIEINDLGEWAWKQLLKEKDFKQAIKGFTKHISDLLEAVV